MKEEIKGELVLPAKPQLQILNRQSVLDFGVIYNGSIKSLHFAIKNCGSQGLQVSCSAAEEWISIIPSAAVLQQGEVREIEIKAEPKNVKLGRQKILLLIKSNDLMEETKQIFILAQIYENSASIELCPNSINLDKIYHKKNKTARVEVKNLGNSSEAASIEVEIKPEDSSWLSYEMTDGAKNQLYITFQINPTTLEPGDYKTTVKIRELFSPDSFPLELPIAFTVTLEDSKITSSLINWILKKI